MNLHERTQALLALVDSHCAARCEELLAPARTQASAIRRAALGEARRRVRTAIAEARKRMAAEVGAAEARLATEQRLHAQRHAKALLGRAWDAVRAELLARWSDPALRALWTEAQLARALDVLPHDTNWDVYAAADWPPAERRHAVAALKAAGVAAVDVRDAPAMRAGLRVRAGSNSLDASLDGLLADRAALEGRLLQMLAESGT